MTNKTLGYIGLLITMCTLSTTVTAHEKEQIKLDKACEEARKIALKPQKKLIYKECLEKFGKSKSECKSEADAYNGNRINGAPMFYELPACEKAFYFRKDHEE